MVSVARVEGGRTAGLGSRGLEGMEMRMCVAEMRDERQNTRREDWMRILLVVGRWSVELQYERVSDAVWSLFSMDGETLRRGPLAESSEA